MVHSVAFVLRCPHVLGAVAPAQGAASQPFGMPGDMNALMGVAARRGGLVTIGEITGHGFSRTWASARVKSEAWQRLHTGIYATFPSEPTWEQRARAALLLAGRQAALCRQAAGFLHRLIKEPPSTIHVKVPHRFVVVAGDGVVIHRTRRPFAMVGDPHRTTLLDTVLDLADTATSDAELVDYLTAGIRQGVSPKAVLAEVARRRYFGNRLLLTQLLDQGMEGMESTLEHMWHQNVVVAHGLPSPTRQARELIRDRIIRSDCWFEAFGLRVELDGELAHPGRATDADVLRDNDTLLARAERTLRYRWPHALPGAACVSAGQVGLGLRQGGWADVPRTCGDGCAAPGTFAQLLAGGGA